jgi:hypothetical protein
VGFGLRAVAQTDQVDHQAADAGAAAVAGVKRARGANTISLMPCFQPGQAFEEGVILGRLLTGYGELEVGMCSCLVTLEGMFDRPIRTLFGGPPGAERRIKVAEGALKVRVHKRWTLC